MLTVHLRVADASTGTATPVRVSFVGPGGAAYAPNGRPGAVPLGRGEAVGGSVRVGNRLFSYIDGGCEIRLPAGVPLSFEAHKGPQFRPVRETVTLGQGQISLRFAVERVGDVRQDGWLAGDSRCHFLSPTDAAVEGAAEGLDFVNLLAAERDYPSPDGTAYPLAEHILAFSGQVPAAERHGCSVVVNTFNVHPVLGRLGLLNTHRPVFPLAFGGERGDGWSLGDWSEQARRKGGLAVWCDAFRKDGSAAGGEGLIAALLGEIDAVEFDAHPRERPLLPWWYRLLNVGCRLPAVGGSGRDRNRVVLGSVRTYAAADGGSGYGSWVGAVRAGRTSVGDGPPLTLRVNGELPGGDIGLASPEVPVRVEAAGGGRLQAVVNGRVAAESRSGRVEAEVQMPEGGWVAARSLDAGFAHTSPVYVTQAGRPAFRDRASPALLREAVRATRGWVEHEAACDDKSRARLLARADEALNRLA